MQDQFSQCSKTSSIW